MQPAGGYKGFGSFHSDNVEELVALSDAEFSERCPPFPFSLSLREYMARTEPGREGGDIRVERFGHAARRHFLVDFSSWCFLNHGAFGATSRYAFEVANEWRQRCEHQPLRFLDREMLPHQVRVIRELSAFVNARPQDLVLLQNATTGLNVLVKSLVKCSEDVVYLLDISYGSTKKIVQAVCDQTGATMAVGTVPIPFRSEDELFESIVASIPEGCTVAVLDWITSNTALTLPIERLASHCRGRGIKAIVDGAHSIGMLPVDLEALRSCGVEYFTGNCHKWGTATLAPLDLCPPGMALVQLPCGGREMPSAGHATSADAKRLQDFLHQAGVEVPIKCIANTLYVRISAHVYNEESDFLLLAQAVDEYRQTSLQHHPDGPPV